MRKWIVFPVVAFSPLFLAACAWTTSKLLLPGEEPRGFVYYECKPLLVVSGSTVSVSYVKNPSKRYSVQFGAFLAKNDVLINFDKDCGITSVKSTMDTTDVLKLIQALAEKALPAASGQKNTVGETNQTMVQVFDVIFDDEGNIVSLRPLVKPGTLTRVPVSPT